MALAAVLGVEQVYSECMNRLEKMILGTPSRTSLPPSLVSKLNQGDVKALEEALVRHFTQFGTLTPADAVSSQPGSTRSTPAEHTTGSVVLTCPTSNSADFRVQQATIPLDYSASQRNSYTFGGVSSYSSNSSSGSRSIQTDVGYESDAANTVDDSGLQGWPLEDTYRYDFMRFYREHELWCESLITTVRILNNRTPMKDAARHTSAESVAATTAGALRSASPAPFGSVTPRFHTPFTSSTATPRPAVTPTPRFARPQRTAAEKTLITGHSPGTDAEYDSDNSPRAGAHASEKHVLTAEDLRVRYGGIINTEACNFHLPW
jgi:hypothetical protein